MNDRGRAGNAALPGRRLLVAVVVVAAIAAALGVTFAIRNYQSYRDEVTTSLASRADRAAMRMNAFVRGRESMLGAVARDLPPRPEPGDLRTAAAMAGEARPDAFIAAGRGARAVTPTGTRAATPGERRVSRSVALTSMPTAVLAPGDPGGMVIGVPLRSGARTTGTLVQQPSRLDAAMLLAPEEVRIVDGRWQARATGDGWRVMPLGPPEPGDVVLATAVLQAAPWRVEAWRPDAVALGTVRRESIMRVAAWLLLAGAAVVLAAVAGRRMDRAIVDERRGRRRLEAVATAARRVAMATSPSQVAEAVLADEALCAVAATVVVRGDHAEVLAWRGMDDPEWAAAPAAVAAIRRQLRDGVVMQEVRVPGLADPITIIPFALDPAASGAMMLRRRPPPRRRMLDDVTAQALATQASEGLQRALAQEREHEERRRAEVLARLNRVLHEGLTVPDRAAAALRVIVPEVADFALIEEVAGEEARVVASLHRDPESLPMVEHEHGPSSVDASGAAARRAVMADGRPRLVSAPGRDAMLATPVMGRRGMSALLLLGTVGDRGRQLTEADLPLARAMGDAIGIGLDNARLFQEQRSIALKLQLSLLPGRLQVPEGIDVAVRFEPGARGVEVGGDWYDVIPLDGGCTGIVVGDVVGRGIEAAAVMGRLRFGFQALARKMGHPGAALDELEAFACDVTGGEMTTVAYAIMDHRRGVVRYSCAGHPPPLVVRGDGSYELLEGGRSAPLNSGPAARRHAATAPFGPGDLLVLYTDGLVERRGSVIDDGIHALARMVAGRAHEDPDAIADEVLRRWSTELDDDLVFLCARVSPVHAAGSPPASHEEDAHAARSGRRSRAGELPGV